MAIADMQGLLRGKYVSWSKLLLVLESGWGVAPLTLALDPDDMITKAPGIVDGSDGFADASNGIP